MALDFFAGCVGGCAGVVVGHPFDTVKVKLQTQDYRNPVYRGTWDCFSKILKTESVRGIYRGVSSPMAGVAVVNAIVFGVHGNIQRNMKDPNTLQSHFLAGAAAGLVQSVVSSPVELLKSRMQTSTMYNSVTECFKHTYKQGGVRGVFKGLTITGMREFLGYGLYFATYEALTRNSDGAPVGTAVMLLAGGFSGVVSWVFTYPLDVVKSRYQIDTGNYSSYADCIKKSIRAEGMVFLTRGLTPTVLRAFPSNAVTFTAVTWVIRLADFNKEGSKGTSEKIDSTLKFLTENRFVKHFLNGSVIKCLESESTSQNQPEQKPVIPEEFWVVD